MPLRILYYNMIDQPAFLHPYLYLAIISCLLSFLFTYFSFNHRQETAIQYFTLFTFANGVWSLAIVLQMVLNDVYIQHLIYFATFPFIAMMCWGWSAFAYQYTFEHPSVRLTNLSFIPLYIIMVSIMAIIMQNIGTYPTIHTVDGVTIVDSFNEHLSILRLWMFALFVYSIPGILFFLWKGRNLTNQNKRQYQLMVLASIIMLLGALISVLRIHPYPDIHIIPMAFSVASLFIWGAIRRYGFFNIIPVARATIIEELPQSVFVVNDKDLIIDTNVSGTDLIDEPYNDVYNTNIFDQIPELKKYVPNGLSEGKMINDVELRNGEIYTICIKPFDDDEGNYVGTTLSFEKVTKLKQHQYELEQQKEELQQQKYMLESQRDELEHQNEQLEQFASVLSHDLRNPLNMAQGYTDLARKEPDNDTYFDNIEKGHERMETMISDLLELAREGKHVEDTTELDLETEAHKSFEMINLDNTTLTVENTFKFNADADRMKNVFENLFRNAKEHSESTETEIRIGKLTDSDGFYIEDNGPGVPDENKDEIFDHGATFSDDGTGFGLSIISQIVEAHGWNITVTDGTELGGARFEITGMK